MAIARALVNRPKLILADEPTAALDRVSTGRVVALLKEMANSGSAVLMVTHDHQVSEQADRIIEMEDGRVIADETPGRTVRLRRFLKSIDPFKPLPPDDLSTSRAGLRNGAIPAVRSSSAREILAMRST